VWPGQSRQVPLLPSELPRPHAFDPMPTTSLLKALAALHVIASANFKDTAARELRLFAQRADAEPESAALLADVHDWLQRQSETLIAHLLERMDDARSLSRVELRFILRSLDVLMVLAGAADLSFELAALHEARTTPRDPREDVRAARDWITAHVDQVRQALRGLIRPSVC
jgi:hypothetical protein